SFSLYLKCSSILALFAFSVLIVACSNSSDTNLGQPVVTVTINLNQSNGSPTPPAPAYTCEAWVTNTSPGIGSPVVDIYAKYVHNVNGNPVGVGQSIATANVLWPDGNVANITSTTTSDGLAVFAASTANRAADLNRIVLVTVSFQASQGAPPCTVTSDRAAFFTLVVATATSAVTPTAAVTATPTVGGTVTPTPTPTPKICPTPGRKKTPTPCPQ
ncbi:MAG TPA: hypothetical protein VKR42_04235, partial [Ktedonobacteraceae bacterium]|nr:hypothetical protein [Ktedonobacteraceae bacterium]